MSFEALGIDDVLLTFQAVVVFLCTGVDIKTNLIILGGLFAVKSLMTNKVIFLCKTFEALFTLERPHTMMNLSKMS